MISLNLKYEPRPEVRESYTETVIARLVSAAHGGREGAALAAIETAAKWWGLGLSSATVKPSNIALSAITPSVLDAIGRGLCRYGESLHVIDVRAGRVMLTPCAQFTVLGNDDPDSWKYLCTLNGPSTARTLKLPSASVVHCRYSPHPSRPWAGRSPVALAIDTARVAGLLEHATAGELSFSQKQVLSPRRNPGDYAPVDTLGPETIQKIVEAFSNMSALTRSFYLPMSKQPVLGLSLQIHLPFFVIVSRTAS